MRRAMPAYEASFIHGEDRSRKKRQREKAAAAAAGKAQKDERLRKESGQLTVGRMRFLVTISAFSTTRRALPSSRAAPAVEVDERL